VYQSLDEQQEVLKEHPRQAEYVYPMAHAIYQTKGPHPKEAIRCPILHATPEFEKFTAEFNHQVNDEDMPTALLLDL